MGEKARGGERDRENGNAFHALFLLLGSVFSHGSAWCSVCIVGAVFVRSGGRFPSSIDAELCAYVCMHVFACACMCARGCGRVAVCV